MNKGQPGIVERIKSENVPKEGMMYAVYNNSIEYRAYTLPEVLSDSKLSDGLLELHLFDEENEYRYIKRRGDDVSRLINDSIYHGDIYCKYEEQVYIDGDDTDDRVCIVNYITFDEDDLIQIENYRLKEVKKP